MNNFKAQLHVSMLDMLAKCGIQFQRRYGSRFGIWDKEEIVAPGIALAIGISVHKSIEANLKNKIKTGNLISLEQIKDLTATEFQSVWDSGLLLTEDESINIDKTKGENLDMAIRLSNLHHSQLAPIIEPLAVEEKFVIELDGFPYDLGGKIDIREAKALRDSKTSGKSPGINDAITTQAATYSLAHKVNYGVYPEKFCIDFLVKTKTPKAITCESIPEDKWINPLIRRIERTTEIIQSVKEGKQALMPADSQSWICSAKWCGYARSCKFWSGRE